MSTPMSELSHNEFVTAFKEFSACPTFIYGGMVEAQRKLNALEVHVLEEEEKLWTMVAGPEADEVRRRIADLHLQIAEIREAIVGVNPMKLVSKQEFLDFGAQEAAKRGLARNSASVSQVIAEAEARGFHVDGFRLVHSDGLDVQMKPEDEEQVEAAEEVEA